MTYLFDNAVPSKGLIEGLSFKVSIPGSEYSGRKTGQTSLTLV